MVVWCSMCLLISDICGGNSHHLWHNVLMAEKKEQESWERWWCLLKRLLRCSACYFLVHIVLAKPYYTVAKPSLPLMGCTSHLVVGESVWCLYRTKWEQEIEHNSTTYHKLLWWFKMYTNGPEVYTSGFHNSASISEVPWTCRAKPKRNWEKQVSFPYSTSDVICFIYQRHVKIRGCVWFYLEGR